MKRFIQNCVIVLLLMTGAWAYDAFAQVQKLAIEMRPFLEGVVEEVYKDCDRCAMFAAKVHVESTWRPNVTSSARAQGLCQATPITVRHIKQRYPFLRQGGPFDKEWCLEAMVRYFNEIERSAHILDPVERIQYTQAAYNRGPTAMRNARRKHGLNWRNHLPKETANYIEKMPRVTRLYRDEGGYRGRVYGG